MTLSDIEHVSLPAYMTILSQEELFVIKQKERKNVVIACGYHESSKKIVLMSESFDILEFSPEELLGLNLVIERAKPINLGSKIEILSTKAYIEIDSTDAINASACIDLSNLQIDMLHEDKVI